MYAIVLKKIRVAIPDNGTTKHMEINIPVAQMSKTQQKKKYDRQQVVPEWFKKGLSMKG